jgi:hypothetical protein
VTLTGGTAPVVVAFNPRGGWLVSGVPIR